MSGKGKTDKLSKAEEAELAKMLAEEEKESANADDASGQRPETAAATEDTTTDEDAGQDETTVASPVGVSDGTEGQAIDHTRVRLAAAKCAALLSKGYSSTNAQADYEAAILRYPTQIFEATSILYDCAQANILDSNRRRNTREVIREFDALMATFNGEVKPSIGGASGVVFTEEGDKADEDGEIIAV